MGIKFFLQLQLFKLHLTPSNILNHPSSKGVEVPTAILNRLHFTTYIPLYYLQIIIIKDFFILWHISLLLLNLLYFLFPFSDESKSTGSEWSFTSMVLYLLTHAYKIQFYFFYLKNLKYPLLYLFYQLSLNHYFCFNQLPFMIHHLRLIYSCWSLKLSSLETFLISGCSLMFSDAYLITCVVNTVKFST